MDFTGYKKKYSLFNTHDDLNVLLSGVNPSGSTSLRDSIELGIKLIMGMNIDLINNDLEQRHFLHIIITDGQDTSSKSKYEDLAALFLTLGMLIPNQMITNHFIGVGFDINSDEGQELDALNILGGDTSDIHFAQNADISSIFSRIQAQIGVVRKTEVQAVANEHFGLVRVQQSHQPYLQIKLKKYIVVFNLDISGSMSGGRWKQVRECVARFTNALSDDDLVTVLLFNDKPMLLQNIVNISVRSTTPPPRVQQPPPPSVQQPAARVQTPPPRTQAQSQSSSSSLYSTQNLYNTNQNINTNNNRNNQANNYQISNDLIDIRNIRSDSELVRMQQNIPKENKCCCSIF